MTYEGSNSEKILSSWAAPFMCPFPNPNLDFQIKAKQLKDSHLLMIISTYIGTFMCTKFLILGVVEVQNLSNFDQKSTIPTNLVTQFFLKTLNQNLIGSALRLLVPWSNETSLYAYISYTFTRPAIIGQHILFCTKTVESTIGVDAYLFTVMTWIIQRTFVDICHNKK